MNQGGRKNRKETSNQQDRALIPMAAKEPLGFRLSAAGVQKVESKRKQDPRLAVVRLKNLSEIQHLDAENDPDSKGKQTGSVLERLQ